MRELGYEHRLRDWMGGYRRRRWTRTNIEEITRELAHEDAFERYGLDHEDGFERDDMDNVAGHLEQGPEEHARRTRNREARARRRRELEEFYEDYVEHPNGEEWSVRTVPAAAGARVPAGAAT